MRFSCTYHVKITVPELEKICKQIKEALKQEKKQYNSPFYMVIENGEFTSVTDELPNKTK